MRMEQKIEGEEVMYDVGIDDQRVVRYDVER